jgi:DNA mismatch repair protein MutS
MKTPLMQNYADTLATLPPGTLLMIRLGDFWEFFGECAEVAAKTLKITLTERQGIKMAGVPYYSVDRYVSQLVEAGHVVAKAEIVNGKPVVS